MDPKACLVAAREAFGDNDLETCQELLLEYREWRRQGGYDPAPPFGDLLANVLGEALSD